VGFAVSVVYGAWNVLAKQCGFGTAEEMMAQYICYDSRSV